MIALALKSCIGALAVLLIAMLSKSRYFVIAGLVPLFPTFALIAHTIVGMDRGAPELRATALFGLFSLVPYAAYLLYVYWSSGRYGLAATLLGATLVWGLAAGLLIAAWLRFHPAAP